jgi:hypothetical protein
VKAAESWTRDDRCLIGDAVLSLVHMSKHGIKTTAVSFLDKGGVAESMVIRGARQDTIGR